MFVDKTLLSLGGEILDRDYRWKYGLSQFGTVMANRQSAVVFLLIAAVVSLCVVPQVDQPQKKFDESDLPTIQATTISLSLSFVRPLVRPITLPKSSDGRREEIRVSSVESASRDMTRHSSPLRKLLCILLI